MIQVPVDLYRLLEAADGPELIDREIPEGAEILELGSGSGRITHPLTALGRRVVAVDSNPEMLELVEGAETVLAHRGPRASTHVRGSPSD